jgi:prevent-host-death family protein
MMGILTASEVRANIYRLMDEAASTHQPILIKGKRHNAVLVSEEDWQAIQETLFLMSVPGMGQSIKEGMIEPLERCSADPGW